jgi:hypothetical protein
MWEQRCLPDPPVWNRRSSRALIGRPFGVWSCVMPRSPSIVPEDADRDVYLVLDDFGYLHGRAWREIDEADADRVTLIGNLLDGQYENPVRIVAFNTADGWSRDVSKDIAGELLDRCAERGEVPASLEDFLQRYQSTQPPSQLVLRL